MPGDRLLASSFTNVPLFVGYELEGLPNRDSLSYPSTYGLPPDLPTMLRGTLRYPGFAKGMMELRELLDARPFGGKRPSSWEELFDVVPRSGIINACVLLSACRVVVKCRHVVSQPFGYRAFRPAAVPLSRRIAHDGPRDLPRPPTPLPPQRARRRPSPPRDRRREARRHPRAVHLVDGRVRRALRLEGSLGDGEDRRLSRGARRVVTSRRSHRRARCHRSDAAIRLEAFAGLLGAEWVEAGRRSEDGIRRRVVVEEADGLALRITESLTQQSIAQHVRVHTSTAYSPSFSMTWPRTSRIFRLRMRT